MLFARKHGVGLLINSLALVLLLGSINVSAQKQKMQHFSASAMGTMQQLGRLINVEIYIDRYSAPEDQKALLEAFEEKGSEGLSNALDKMNSKGRIAITGTLGFDVNYIREFKTPDGGRKIRFVTDRPIRFAEHWGSTRSTDYDLSMGEINIPKKGKMTGTIMPVAKFRLNKEKEIEIETFQNPWNLVNLKLW